jgi:hypothetical protein
MEGDVLCALAAVFYAMDVLQLFECGKILAPFESMNDHQDCHSHGPAQTTALSAVCFWWLSVEFGPA